MFTGIIERCGRVVALEPTPTGQRLVVEAEGVLGADQVALGDSVAVDGCCLTVAALPAAHQAGFDVIPVTLERTALGRLEAGSAVNLERALAMGGRLDGHLVQGHVDGVARCTSIEETEEGGWQVTFEPAPGSETLVETMIPRGSVAISGVSLTLAILAPPTFGVALIPKTRELTNLGDSLRVGQAVNIETDMIGKYVKRFLEASGLGARGTDSP